MTKSNAGILVLLVSLISCKLINNKSGSSLKENGCGKYLIYKELKKRTVLVCSFYNYNLNLKPGNYTFDLRNIDSNLIEVFIDYFTDKLYSYDYCSDIKFGVKKNTYKPVKGMLEIKIKNDMMGLNEYISVNFKITNATFVNGHKEFYIENEDLKYLFKKKNSSDW